MEKKLNPIPVANISANDLEAIQKLELTLENKYVLIAYDKKDFS